MSYFRANAHLIAKMINKDCLRYDKNNLASIITLCEVSYNKGNQLNLVVRVFGEQAEQINRLGNEDFWYEIKGDLNSYSPGFNEIVTPKISINARSINRIPVASSSFLHCELIGRLTREPEKIIKSESFEFARFSVAVNRENTNKTNYFDISVFKPTLIQVVSNQLNKGQTVYAAGELSFYGKASGDELFTSVKLERLLLLENKIK